eukprot:TRINITY_DN64730_c0_g1_i1.p1 TRINITY_DN64730_c0_g1~~TRINITY_DN64730_c0_g1_i1.p1  ORF type:complete len:388 (-),score=51.80 TRINITY_DN64730_c0_g1_i1:333-1460(-)
MASDSVPSELSEAQAIPAELLSRSLSCLDRQSLGRCSNVCHGWKQISTGDDCWRILLASHCGDHPYSVKVSLAGVHAWLERSRDHNGDVARISESRGHLRRLQASSGLHSVFRYLHCFHGVVEAEPQHARLSSAWYCSAQASTKITLEALNFWPFEVWVWLRARAPDSEWDDVGDDGVNKDSAFSGVDLSSCAGRLRCWNSSVDSSMDIRRSGGQKRAWLLDCLPRGVLLRLPAFSGLEIGSHRLEGQVGPDKTMLLTWVIGAWPSNSEGKNKSKCEAQRLSPSLPPLPPCSPNVFIDSSSISEEIISAMGEEEGEDEKNLTLELPELAAAADEVGANNAVTWLHDEVTMEPGTGRQLGPTLCSGSVELDLSVWL